MKPICIIAGLTATGKSKVAIALAKVWNAEIISADSVAVYRELNIGSAKPSISEREGVVHHLIDVCSYQETYNVARFQKDARECIENIQQRGKNVIVVGGTGLYIKALLNDYRFKEEEHQVSLFTEADLTADLYDKLLSVDAKTGKSIHPNNRKRIIRALESFEAHQVPRNEITEDKKNIQLIPACVFFLQGDRESVYQRINNRVERMFEIGLENEVRTLYETDRNLFKYQSIQSIGYREFEDYFLSKIDRLTLIDRIQRNTRRLAKRQITWFKHQQVSVWIDVFEESVFDVINEALKNTWNEGSL